MNKYDDLETEYENMKKEYSLEELEECSKNLHDTSILLNRKICNYIKNADLPTPIHKKQENDVLGAIVLLIILLWFLGSL